MLFSFHFDHCQARIIIFSHEYRDEATCTQAIVNKIVELNKSCLLCCSIQFPRSWSAVIPSVDTELSNGALLSMYASMKVVININRIPWGKCTCLLALPNSWLLLVYISHQQKADISHINSGKYWNSVLACGSLEGLPQMHHKFKQLSAYMYM